ncbi:MAG: PrsW family glutamic-type intramembrane protease [Cyclobacteriaceae bacterium]
MLYPNKNFNEPFDGIVYAVSVSLGFAGLENILYVTNSPDGIATGIMRMFTAVPAHATFAVLMGYFLGRAKCEPGKSYLAWYGLLTATLFHGAYDYFWFISYIPGIWTGAIASLIIGLVLSRKAIKMHQQASPFISASDSVNENNESKN